VTASVAAWWRWVCRWPDGDGDSTLIFFAARHRAELRGPWQAGAGPGDQFLFAGDVFDRSGGVLLGTNRGICTTITGTTRQPDTCRPRSNLDGGQITVQALLNRRAVGAGRAVPLGSSAAPASSGTPRDATIRYPRMCPTSGRELRLNVVTG